MGFDLPYIIDYKIFIVFSGGVKQKSNRVDTNRQVNDIFPKLQRNLGLTSISLPF